MTKTADVAPYTTILSTWGNTIRDRTAQTFANVAERDAQWPSASAPDGAVCLTLDTHTVWKNWAGTGWRSAAPNVGSRPIAAIGPNYDPSKPADVFVTRVAYTTDASGIATISITAQGLPRPPVCIMGATLTPVVLGATAYVQTIVNLDSSTLTSLYTRSFSVAGAAAASLNLNAILALWYQ